MLLLKLIMINTTRLFFGSMFFPLFETKIKVFYFLHFLIFGIVLIISFFKVNTVLVKFEIAG